MPEYALDNVGIRRLVVDDKSGPQRLYTANEVSKVVGMTRHWVLEHCARTGAPTPEFTVMRGDLTQPLWTEGSLDRWRAYHAGDVSGPDHGRYSGYSDHNAVNQVGPVTVTWKLSWRCMYDGGALWLFSTPRGWYISNDDGVTWDFADTMVRPTGYRYFSVNANVNPGSTISRILRSCEKLRRSIEKDISQ
jgi:hypothetical protein